MEHGSQQQPDRGNFLFEGVALVVAGRTFFPTRQHQRSTRLCGLARRGWRRTIHTNRVGSPVGSWLASWLERGFQPATPLELDRGKSLSGGVARVAGGCLFVSACQQQRPTRLRRVACSGWWCVLRVKREFKFKVGFKFKRGVGSKEMSSKFKSSISIKLNVQVQVNFAPFAQY